MLSAYERETVINMCDAENKAYIESYQKYWIKRILKAKEKSIKNGNPDDVVIVRQTEDMIEAIVPRKYIKITATPYCSPERREKMKQLAAERFGKKVEEISDDYGLEDDDLEDEEIFFDTEEADEEETE